MKLCCLGIVKSFCENGGTRISRMRAHMSAAPAAAPPTRNGAASAPAQQQYRSQMLLNLQHAANRKSAPRQPHGSSRAAADSRSLPGRDRPSSQPTPTGQQQRRMWVQGARQVPEAISHSPAQAEGSAGTLQPARSNGVLAQSRSQGQLSAAGTPQPSQQTLPDPPEGHFYLPTGHTPTGCHGESDLASGSHQAASAPGTQTEAALRASAATQNGAKPASPEDGDCWGAFQPTDEQAVSAAPNAGSEKEDTAATAAQQEKEAKEQRLQELKDRLMAGILPEVHVVDEVEDAERVCQLLMTRYKDRVFACDTEVADIDVKKQSPCGHGTVICFSVYGGKDIHMSNEPPAARPGGGEGVTKNQLWVDTYCGGDEAKGKAVMAVFKEFFEADGIKKVWHNYSFDRHVLSNNDVHCQGFAGDTMHMARLNDSSRKGKLNYSLASLTGDAKIMKDSKEYSEDNDERGKISMKELFGRKNINKDGKEGKIIQLASMEHLQTSEDTRAGWINYSAFDAKSTYLLQQALASKLKRTECNPDPAIREALGLQQSKVFKMMDFYDQFWKPFGRLLTDMEKEGMLVDREHLKAAELKAKEDQDNAQRTFRDWAKRKVPDAEFMNVGSGTQIRQLLFPDEPRQMPPGNTGKREYMPAEKVFKVPNVNGIIEPGKKVAKKNMDITLYGLWQLGGPSKLKPEIYTPSGWPAVSTVVLRSLAGKPGAAKKALAELEGRAGDVREPLSELDLPEEEGQEEPWTTDSVEIAKEKLARKKGGQAYTNKMEDDKHQKVADKGGFGKMYAAFGGDLEGLAACSAVDSLCEMGAIDTLLSNFILPLQDGDIATTNPDGTLGRVHCSLNINTETGRLSARRPNLQNQPALEKDRYKVRKAFTADKSKDHHLVVADYGQLELRLLAHMTSCKSMLDAFKLGGDFHSRTALGMYDHIKEAIHQGKCILEYDGPHGTKSPVPLLKDMFSSERRKAKVLNFSIAYGKTAHGLAKDWKVDINEAQDTVNKWYSDRPEVLAWQEEQRTKASTKGYVETMMGRRRYLPDATGGNPKARGHALRAAINTPIQGSAADVATAAMIQISECQELKRLGWKLLLQVHDEVILEGPRESAAEAKVLVVKHMENPFNHQNPLLVDLNVDANTALTWYEAK